MLKLDNTHIWEYRWVYFLGVHRQCGAQNHLGDRRRCIWQVYLVCITSKMIIYHTQTAALLRVLIDSCCYLALQRHRFYIHKIYY